MPRNMSFAMTTEQIRNRTKTVTRRFGWKFLKPGYQVRAVEKAMGLKKGEKVKPLGMIEIVSTRWEPLNEITKEDVVKEGYPEMTPEQFVQKLVKHYRVKPDAMVHRIEFKYLDLIPDSALTESKLYKLKHMLGVNRIRCKKDWGYRNRYCAKTGSPDHTELAEMEKEGLVYLSVSDRGMVYYRATIAGAKAAGFKKYQLSRIR